MDIQVFVQNVKQLLDERGISYSRAGRESGAGIDFIRNMDRLGTAPSIEKVSKMAEYLDVSVGELLGEEKEPAPVSGELTADEVQVALAYRAADERTRQMVDLALEPWKKSVRLDRAM